MPGSNEFWLIISIRNNEWTGSVTYLKNSDAVFEILPGHSVDKKLLFFLLSATSLVMCSVEERKPEGKESMQAQGEQQSTPKKSPTWESDRGPSWWEATVLTLIFSSFKIANQTGLPD